MTTGHFAQGDATTYVDYNGHQVAKFDVDKREFELGGMNWAGEDSILILKDGHGRQLFRLNTATGNLTVGGLNPEQGQDGDLILKDQVGRETIRLSAGNAKVTIGGGSSESELVLRDPSGKAVFTLSGKSGDLTAGGEGTAGRLMVTNDDGKVTAGLDGAKNSLQLRSPNGTIFNVTVSDKGELKATKI